MPLCIKCNRRFHPDFCILENATSERSECVFCFTKKDVVTIEDEKTGKVVAKVTKEEAINRYKEYVDKMCNTRNIKSIIDTGAKPRIYMPGEM